MSQTKIWRCHNPKIVVCCRRNQVYHTVYRIENAAKGNSFRKYFAISLKTFNFATNKNKTLSDE